MARAGRVKVTVTQSMAMALELLAERERLPIATVAKQVLRAGLDRTIHSAEGQKRLTLMRAFQTHDEWLDQQAEAAEEMRQ